jgi:hypothetical protein
MVGRLGWSHACIRAGASYYTASQHVPSDLGVRVAPEHAQMDEARRHEFSAFKTTFLLLRADTEERSVLHARLMRHKIEEPILK